LKKLTPILLNLLLMPTGCALGGGGSIKRADHSVREIPVTDISSIRIGQVEDAVVEIVCGTGDKAAIDRLAGRKNKVFYDAPLAVFISSDNNNGWSEVDAGIAVQNLALAAHAMGLGSVIIGMCKCAFAGERGEQLAKTLRFPEGYRFTIAIAIGHPSMGKDAHDIKPGKIEVI